MAGLTNNTVVSSSIYMPKNGIFSLPSFFVFFLVLLLLSPVVPRAAAQQPQADDNGYYRNFSPSMAVIIVVLVAALFFMGFFSIYIRHCNESSAGNSVRQALSMRRRAAARGLDASMIETFPTFSYAEVKDHKIGKGALECAVCLNEFEDDETLRLIPKCDHVFHPECIDAWLEAHVTCPVCRANLAPQPGDEPVQTPELPTQDRPQEDGNDQAQNEEISVHVVSDQEQQQQQQQGDVGSNIRAKSVKRNLSFNVPNRPPRSFSIKRPKMFSKFRSHSTGHSLVLPGENLDRYTLKLPEDVRKEMMNRALLNRARSVAVHLPRDASSRRGYRTGAGEGSSRGGRSYRRMDQLNEEGRSDRWLFSIVPPLFSRWPSMKSPKVVADNGEASSSTGGKTAVRMPSFKCLEPKGDETGLVPSSSARPPV